MAVQKNFVISGSGGKPMLTDIFFGEPSGPKPVLIYAHGFNGFKDWGGFDLLAAQAASAGFVFIKFNFSHNGTTPEAPEDFTDLEAFAENNYTKELDDLAALLDWVSGDNKYEHEMDRSRIGLIGHSMGGGIALIKAAEDRRVGAIATWASISECKTPWGSWPAGRLAEWKAQGVQFILNSRTGQQMPLGYQLLGDFEDNAERLDIKAAIARLEIPVLICHGTADTSVPVSSAHALAEAQARAELFLVDSDHVFGRRHPWTEPRPPMAMQQVMDRTLEFFRLRFAIR